MSGFLALPVVGLGLLLLTLPVLVLVLLGLVVALRRRVRTLEARVAGLERARAGAVVVEPGPPEPAGPEPAVSGAGETPEPAGPPLVAEPVPAAAAQAGAPGVGRLEERVGGTWLNRIGALVLVLGAGFFLKHAVDQDWIGPAGRVAIGLVAGLALLGLGERLRREPYATAAQGVTAAGLAILYGSIYAAHAFYELVPAAWALGGLCAVAGLGTALAVRAGARALAFLAALGGFLAPALLSTEMDRAEALFAYLAVLSAGFLFVARRRRWPELALVAFGFTQGLYWSWLERFYEVPRLPVALLGATLFFALFALGGTWAGRRVVARLLLGAVPAAYFLAARRLLAEDHRDLLALVCLGVGALYALGAMRARREATTAGETWPRLAVAIGMLTLALAVRLEERALVVGWSVEAVILLGGGLRTGARPLRLWALLVVGLAWLRWITLLDPPTSYDGWFLLGHPAAPGTAAVAGAALAMALLYRRREPVAEGREAWAPPLLFVLGLASLALLLHDALNPQGPLRLPLAYQHTLGTMGWTVAALPMLSLVPADRTGVLLLAASLLLLTVGLAASGVEATEWAELPARLRPLGLNPRFLVGLLIVVVYALYARVVRDAGYLSERSRGRLAALAGGAAVLLLLWTLSVEVMLWPLVEHGPREADKLRQASLSVLWTLFALAGLGIGLRRGSTALRQFAIALFGVTIGKVLLVDTSTLDALYRILSLVVLGAVLLAVSFLYARLRRRAPPEAS